MVQEKEQPDRLLLIVFGFIEIKCGKTILLPAEIIMDILTDTERDVKICTEMEELEAVAETERKLFGLHK